MAPCVNAFWGKNLFEELWKGILRKICIGTLSRTLPKGIMPLGTPCYLHSGLDVIKRNAAFW